MSIELKNMWFFLVFFPLIPIVFKALMALDVGNLFKKNKVWEIRLIFALVSIIISYLTAEAFVRFIDAFASFFN